MEIKPVTVTFGAGVDESDDQQGTKLSGFPTLENMVWEKETTPQRRGGFVDLRQAVPEGELALGFVTSGNDLGVVSDRYTHHISKPLEAASAFDGLRLSAERMGPFYTGKSDTFPATAGRAVDVAYIGGASPLACVVTLNEYESGSDHPKNIALTVVDLTNKIELVTDTDYLPQGAVCARICTVTNPDDDIASWVLVAVDTDFKYIVRELRYNPTTNEIDSADVYTSASAEVFDSAAFTGIDLVAGAVDGQFYLAYPEDAGGGSSNMSVVRFDLDGTQIEVVDVTTPTNLPGLGISVLEVGSSIWVACGFGSSIGGRIWELTGAGHATVSSPLTFGGSNYLVSTAMCQDGAASVFLSYSGIDASPIDWYTGLSTVSTGLVTSVATFPSAFQVAKPFKIGDEPHVSLQPYWGNRYAEHQRSTTVRNAHGKSVTQVAWDVVPRGFEDSDGTGSTFSNMPSNTPATDAGFHLLPAVTVVSDPSLGDTETADLARMVTCTQLFELSPSGPVVSATVTQIGSVASDIPVSWDGRHELPLSLPTPEISDVTLSSGSGSGTYTLVAVLERVDAKGQAVRSSPSRPVSTTLSSQKAAITIRADVSGVPSTITCRLYATHAGGSSYTLHSTPGLSGAGTWSKSNVDFVSTTYHANESYDPSGAVLLPEMAPPMSHVWSHGNRVFGIRPDEPETVAFSDELSTLEYPQWNAVRTLRVDNAFGPPYAGASMDDKCLIFQKDKISMFAGNGPDDTGSGVFSIPVGVADVGTDNPQSVVAVKAGVLFQHSTGIKSIGPDLTVTDIGLQIADTLGDTPVTRARYLPSLHQVWLLTGEGTFRVFVLDVRYGRWSVFKSTSHDPLVDVIEHRGRVYCLTETRLLEYSAVNQYDSDLDDVQTGIIGKVRTPWVRADYAGQVRLHRVMLTLNALDPVDQEIRVRAYTQDSLQAGHDAAQADHEYTWGSDILGALPYGPCSLQVRLVTRRCTAFQLEFEFRGEGAGFRPAALTMDVGKTQSRHKTPAGMKPSAS